MVPCTAFYSSKMGAWNGSQTMWDLFQNPNFNVDNLSFIVSRTLACVSMPMYAYACMKHAYAELEYAYACTRMHAHMVKGLEQRIVRGGQ